MSKELDPTQRMRLSLDGLSVGDALGERFFGPPADAARRIEARALPTGPWRYTDDTEMAISIVEVLVKRGELDPDMLADRFAQRFNPTRGYGGGAQKLLRSFQNKIPWQVAASELFGGSGSYGNGSAMRVAPLGAFLADDLSEVVDQAARSAVVTHAHPEGVAGAVAVAVAAAAAYRQSAAGTLDGAALFEMVLDKTPDSETRQRTLEASGLHAATPAHEAARRLGSGQNVSCPDTVPFVIWCAAHNLADYVAAFWHTVSGLGDRDTTCAMVGGIVALSSRSVPADWMALREPLPNL